jgi:hypothetical protein
VAPQHIGRGTNWRSQPGRIQGSSS